MEPEAHLKICNDLTLRQNGRDDLGREAQPPEGEAEPPEGEAVKEEINEATENLSHSLCLSLISIHYLPLYIFINVCVSHL